MTALKIRYKDPSQLTPRLQNPRTHTARQIKQIVESIKNFGFINPILIDGADEIIAGHARADAAKLIGMSDVPTVRVDHLTPAQVLAYVIADNRLAENAGWDRELLSLEARDEKRLLRLQRQLAGYKLLIIDELGYVPLSQTGAELLFEVFSQRYERGSTIVTSNLPFDEWTSVFGSERLTGALLDRLTHHVHILEMNGDSYRLNHSKRSSRRASPADNPTQA
jgi:IstB-like ATP binding protein/ParB-like nuclease domain